MQKVVLEQKGLISIGEKRGVIIASYTWGADAMNWGSLTEEERVAKAVACVEKLHPNSTQYFEIGKSWVWHEPHEEFFSGGGAFTWFLPQQWTRLYEGIIKPESKLHLFN